MPWIATAFVIVTLSSIGLPGTNGFVGEFLILSGTWLARLATAPWFAAVGATGVILGAVYMLVLVEKVFFGPIQNQKNAALPDFSVREWFVIAPLLVLIVRDGPHAPALPRPGPRRRWTASSRASPQAEQRLRQTDPGRASRPPARSLPAARAGRE